MRMAKMDSAEDIIIRLIKSGDIGHERLIELADMAYQLEQNADARTGDE